VAGAEYIKRNIMNNPIDNLKKNKGQLIGAVLGVSVVYFFGTYWFSDTKPTGISYKLFYAVIVYILIEGSILIGAKYIDRGR
jgi:hypothetical protein